MGHPPANIVAYLAMILAAPLIWWGYKRFRPQPVTFWAMFGTFMFMPQLTVDPPVLPALDKVSIPALAVILVLPKVARARFRAARPLRGIDALVFVAMFGIFGTLHTNGDALHHGIVTRQGMTLYDAISNVIIYTTTCYLPFLIGRTVFRTSADLHDFFRCFVIAGLLYMPLLLIEVRLSPQMHNWVYGFFPHSFAQTRRGGGFRPVVFLGHGLIVARLMIGVLIAAAIVWKSKVRVTRISNGLALVMLAVTMVLCKSLGGILFAAIAVPLILFTRPEIQMRVAAFMSLIALLYPLLRFSGNVPVDDLLEFSFKLSEERAGSLEFRFRNEDLLLERAVERPWFGWGGYGRNRVFDEEGKDATVTDGEWIIIFGIYGLVGFIGSFGLYVLPVLVAARNLKRIKAPRDKALLSALGLMAAMFATDLLPNSVSMFPHYFVAGVLYGTATGLLVEARNKAAAPASRQRALVQAPQPPEAMASRERVPDSG